MLPMAAATSESQPDDVAAHLVGRDHDWSPTCPTRRLFGRILPDLRLSFGAPTHWLDFSAPPLQTHGSVVRLSPAWTGALNGYYDPQQGTRRCREQVWA